MLECLSLIEASHCSRWESYLPSGAKTHKPRPQEVVEGNPLKLSRVDGEPRVVNLTGGTHHDGDMLRVGDWRQLKDPADHQARHIILANLRRAAPDRTCLLCSYNMASRHDCPISVDKTVKTHCKTCCLELCGPSHESINSM